jgi:hypothetical protein
MPLSSLTKNPDWQNFTPDVVNAANERDNDSGGKRP